MMYELVFPFGLNFHSSTNAPLMYKMMLAINETMTPDVSIPGIPSDIMVITGDEMPRKCARKKATRFRVRTKNAEKSG